MKYKTNAKKLEVPNTKLKIANINAKNVYSYGSK